MFLRWKTCWQFGYTTIDRVVCIRETDKTLWIRSERTGKIRQVRKHTDSEQYHDTWEEAKMSLVSKHAQAIEHLQFDLAKCQQQLKVVQALVKPINDEVSDECAL